MKTVKILCQGFYPDIVAAGELLFELAERLVNKHDIDVSVITAQPSFVKKDKLSSRETINGVKIRRLSIFNFNKNTLVGKFFNSWSFFFKALFVVLFAPKNDWLLIPTSPPLLPLIGTVAKFLYGQRYIYLMHDVYPEIASRLGYIKDDGFIYKIWNFLNIISLKNADRIVVLSEDMKLKLTDWSKDIDRDRISIIYNWSNEDMVKIIPKEENYFLDKYSLRNKFIVEYSGNFGRIHEFETLLKAAKELKKNEDIVFLFIGDGGKKSEIESFVKKHTLKNVLMLPYQERSEIPFSLGMADIQVLSLKKGYEKLAVPSKFYGILASGKPVIFIGDKNCHIARVIDSNNCGFNIETGNSKVLADAIAYFEKSRDELIKYGFNSRKAFENNYTLGKSIKLYLKCINEERESVYRKALINSKRFTVKTAG
ncbi:MAG: glycosyltransferase family 4 protein [Candidatus Gastranaerophilales bacterium]|nr:glycosyltransferase family 4 protein [Candidatus Gastranaerophilales bacterium]